MRGHQTAPRLLLSYDACQVGQRGCAHLLLVCQVLPHICCRLFSARACLPLLAGYARAPSWFVEVPLKARGH
jgi:hypothetical protein